MQKNGTIYTLRIPSLTGRRGRLRRKTAPDKSLSPSPENPRRGRRGDRDAIHSFFFRSVGKGTWKHKALHET